MNAKWWQKVWGDPPPCEHPHMRVRKWVEDNTPMVEMRCPDCGYYDRGHVHGDVEGWADDSE
jgi:Zn ribbon nucleic-acid-binding protein